MHSDLLRLQAGESVKRLRVLEERLALFTRIGIFAALIVLLAVGIFFEVNREMKNAAERRQQQVGRNVAHGASLMDQGKFLESLPPFVEALSLDQNDPVRRKTHRVRIAAVLQQCPKIVQMWFLDSNLNSAALSRDGRLVLAARANNDTATLCDLGNGNTIPLHVDHTDDVEAVSFSRDGRYAVTSSDDKSARVWELGTNKPPLLLPHEATVYSA